MGRCPLVALPQGLSLSILALCKADLHYIIRFPVSKYRSHGFQQSAPSSFCYCRAAGMPGGSAARNTSEQHPFHLHGHHFWVLGSGVGTYNSSVQASLNLVNPIYRDTEIVPEGGWTVIRFVVSWLVLQVHRHKCLECICSF